MTIRFRGKAVPFHVWKCEDCPSADRAKRPDGLPSNFCKACETKFLAAINAGRAKKDKLWFIRTKEKAK